ncbi:DNA mismatch repair endonuclease MutL [Staphylospora marina]|uniref:DNA mismatch repair endonuclease MutL n=1 Tax=Staphylospora marina TaxID=2490858 RepID=UPI000F5BF711|nr:DNA mismatch repair endonuclease MutL [Staphylospora marina]
MGKIRLLDDHLANQIAAGEVVERPASVVKELVENAIDAGASRIQVRIEEGGISLIRVSDNGSGMDAEDAVLAFSRHATSKIRQKRDLFSIRTLGFRGEALPSIASVAKVTLTTSCDSGESATRVSMEGGKILRVEETNRSRGTDVEVRDLFFNTPARLKYLKTVGTEVSHVADAVSRLALAHPGIAFSLHHDARELLRTSGDGKVLHVLHALYGRQVSGKMVPFRAEDMDFEVEGFLTRPEVTRSGRSHLSVILNGRNVRSVPLVQAVLRAYGTLLPSGRWPIGVLMIRMDPKLVDVNVHPAKLEVRLSKESECCRLIERAVREALQRQHLIPSAWTDPGGARIRRTEVVQEALDWKAPGDGSPRSSETVPMRSPVDEPALPRIGDRSSAVAYHAESSSKEEPLRVREAVRDPWEPQRPTPAAENRPSAGGQLHGEPEEAREMEIFEAEEDRETERRRMPMMQPLAQVHGTYVVAQSEDGFYLIDQHAAHERIYYEYFLRKMEENVSDQQPLLIPLTVECTPAESEILEMHRVQLHGWGLDLEPFGGSTWLVRAYPSWFPKEDAVALLHEIIDWLKSSGKVETSKVRDASAKMMACKAAIKANRHLRREEMEALLEQLDGCDNPYTCPHGRPVFVHFSTRDLEKMFKRVM